jgi:hypothetical protein
LGLKNLYPDWFIPDNPKDAALQKLRQKFPEHRNLSDQELALRVIKLYPVYEDLLGDIARESGPALVASYVTLQFWPDENPRGAETLIALGIVWLAFRKWDEYARRGRG